MKWRAAIAFGLMVAALMLVVVLPGLGFVERLRQMVNSPPPPADVAPLPVPPITVALEDSWGVDCDLSHTCQAGHWRAYRRGVRTQACGSEVWNRYFATGAEGTSGGGLQSGSIRLMQATDSSIGPRALTPLIVGSGQSKPGTSVQGWEFQKIPGLSGNYIVTLSWALCPDGSSGQRTIYVVPFSWPNEDDPER